MTRDEFLHEFKMYVRMNFDTKSAADDFFGMQRGQIKRVIDGEYKKIPAYILTTMGYKEITPQKTYEKV